MTVELDNDSNGAVDIELGGTNATTTRNAQINLGVASTFATVALAEAVTGSDNEFIKVVQTETQYRYESEAAGHTPDSTFVLSTGDGGNTRWLAVSGKYMLDGLAVTGDIAVTGTVDGVDIEHLNSHVDGLMGTGHHYGGVISVDTDTTKFDISSGEGHVVDHYTDPENPVLTHVPWVLQDAIDIADLGDGGISGRNATWIGFNSAGTIVQSATAFTSTQLRDIIALGGVFHYNRTTISGTFADPRMVTEPVVALSDLSTFLSPLNGPGNEYTANGANLLFDKSAGTTFATGSNFDATTAGRKSPNITDDAEQLGITSYLYGYQDGSGGVTLAQETAIVPGSWDDGDGTLGTVGADQWTIQRVYFSNHTGLTAVLFGQKLYASLTEAKADIEQEQPWIPAEANDWSWRSSAAIKGNTTALNNETENYIKQTGDLAGGSGGSTGVTTFLHLTDTPSSYALPNALYSVNDAGDAVTESTTTMDADGLHVVGDIDTTGTVAQTIYGEDTGLIFDMAFEEIGTGVQYDRSQNGTSLNSWGTPTVAVNGGQYGSGVLLNGTTDYYELPTTNFPTGNEPFTVELRLKSDTLVSDGYAFAFGTAVNDQGFVLGQNSSGQPKVGFYGSDAIDFTMATDTWYFVQVTYDGTTLNVYVDNVLAKTEVITGNIILAEAFIGKQIGAAEYWEGNLDMARMYTRALTLPELRTHYMRHGGNSVAKTDRFSVVDSHNHLNMEVTDVYFKYFDANRVRADIDADTVTFWSDDGTESFSLHNDGCLGNFADGTTGITQSAADNSTKLATTAYADLAGSGYWSKTGTVLSPLTAGDDAKIDLVSPDETCKLALGDNNFVYNDNTIDRLVIDDTDSTLYAQQADSYIRLVSSGHEHRLNNALRIAITTGDIYLYALSGTSYFKVNNGWTVSRTPLFRVEQANGDTRIIADTTSTELVSPDGTNNVTVDNSVVSLTADRATFLDNDLGTYKNTVMTEIYDVSDFPTPVGGVITLPTGHYQIKGTVDIGVNRFEFATGNPTVLFEMDESFKNAIEHSGSSMTLFSGAGTFRLLGGKGNAFVLTGNSVKFIDIVGSFGMQFSFIGFYGTGGTLGEVTGKVVNDTATAGLILRENVISGWEDGFTVTNADVIRLRAVDTTASSLSGQGIFLTVLGKGTVVTVDKVKMEAGGDVAAFKFDPTIETPVTVSNSIVHGGANFFWPAEDPGIWNAANDQSIGATAITSVTDEGGIVRFHYTPGTDPFKYQEVILSGFTTNTDYNGTFIVAFSGVGYFDIDTIDFGSDETGSWLSNSMLMQETSTLLNEGDTVFLDTTGSTLYDGGTYIYNKTANTYQVNRTFTSIENGTWDRSGLDEHSKYVNSFGNGAQADSKGVSTTLVVANAALTTTSGLGTWDPINLGTALTGGSNSNFKLINTTTGEVEYTGLHHIDGISFNTITVIKTGNAVNYKFRVRKITGTGNFDPAEIPHSVSAASSNLPLMASGVLEPGDTFRIEVENQTNTDSITVTDFFSAYR